MTLYEAPVQSVSGTGRSRLTQPVVCTSHRGLTQGLLDVLDSLRSFVPKGPDRAGCLIEIEAGRPLAITSEEKLS